MYVCVCGGVVRWWTVLYALKQIAFVCAHQWGGTHACTTKPAWLIRWCCVVANTIGRQHTAYYWLSHCRFGGILPYHMIVGILQHPAVLTHKIARHIFRKLENLMRNRKNAHLQHKWNINECIRAPQQITNAKYFNIHKGCLLCDCLNHKNQAELNAFEYSISVDSAIIWIRLSILWLHTAFAHSKWYTIKHKSISNSHLAEITPRNYQ